MRPRSRTSRCSSAASPTARSSRRRTTAPTVGSSAAAFEDVDGGERQRRRRVGPGVTATAGAAVRRARPRLRGRAESRRQPAVRRLLRILQSVTVYDVATGRPLRSASVPAAWLEISPDGSLLAVAGGNEVVILDAATLTERRRLQGHTEWRAGDPLLTQRRAARIGLRRSHRHRVGRHHRRTPRAAAGPLRRGVGCRLQPRRATRCTPPAGRTLLTWDLDRRAVDSSPAARSPNRRPARWRAMPRRPARPWPTRMRDDRRQTRCSSSTSRPAAPGRVIDTGHGS